MQIFTRPRLLISIVFEYNTVFEYEKDVGGVFKNCTSLKKVIFKNVIPELAKKTFEGCVSKPEILLLKAPIKDWKDRDCMAKPQAAVGFMNAFVGGTEFDEELIKANKKWINSQKKKLLDIVSEYPQSVVYMTREKMLDNDDVEYILEKSADNAEITAVLNEYKK